MKDRFLLLYGSQTGNSQDIAETIQSESIEYQIVSCCQSMDDYKKINLIGEELVVFVCSTTGQGDEPDNMKSFWKFLLKKSLPSNSLTNMKYAILGLGDSSYTKYNYVAKRLNKRLLQLGASPFVPLTLVDEQSPVGPDVVVELWLDKLWHSLFAYFGISWMLRKSEVYLKPLLKYQLSTPDEAQHKTDFDKIHITDHQPSPLMYASLEKNERLTPKDHFQDTRLLTLDIQNYKNKYQPFDILVVYPQNMEDTISTFKDFYGLDLDQVVDVIHTRSHDGNDDAKESFLQKYPHILDPSTSSRLKLHDLVAKFMDLQSVPRRSFFRHLAYYSLRCYDLINDLWTKSFSNITLAPLSDYYDIKQRERITKFISLRLSECLKEEKPFPSFDLDQMCPQNIMADVMREYKNRLEAEKDRLAELCAPNDTGREELYSYCNRVRRNTCEVLHDFPATAQAIPFVHLLSIVPSIQPRSFSMANACDYLYKQHPAEGHQDNDENTKAQILVAVVEYKTKLYKPRKGTCSFWLSTLQTSTKIPVCFKPGYVQLFPSMLEKPLILVGPGTGVAPLRALIQQRVSMNIGGNYLFFGCRNRAKDHYFATEFAHYESIGLLKSYNAYSRDQPDRVYVQHIIRRESQLVHQLLVEDGALVYISGRSKNMPDEVLKAFGFVLITHGDYDVESAKTFVEKMVAQKRIQMETWD